MAAEPLISPVQISDAIQLSRQAVDKRARRESWPFEIVNKRGDRRFILGGLPQDVRAALAGQNTTQKGGTGPGPVLSLINNKERRVVPVGSPELNDQQNRIALARADLVRFYLQEKERAKVRGQSKTRAADMYIAGYNTGALHPHLFEILGECSKQTVERWVKTFRDANFDYEALAPQWGNRRGDRKVTDVEWNTLLSFALHPNRLPISEAIRLAQMTLTRRMIPSSSHKDTLRRALIEWKNTHYDQWVFAREGEKALNDKCLPYLERDAGLLDVGEVLVADGHTLNFQILHPFTGKPCRMTMVAWYDWASAMMAGWEIMPTENVQCVAAGLRRAILRMGKMPRVAYLDNGKAFKAKVFTSQDVDFQEAGFYGMFARLGIETIFAWPYNAQSKPVERFFETFAELERCLPSYIGTSIEKRPAHMRRNERLHKQLHEKKYGGWVPTVVEANRIIEGWMAEYANRPHRGLRGLCPGEVFAAGKGPGVDEKALRHLMMSIELKDVRRNGIHFMGRNYYDESLYGLREKVLIRYDFEDLSKVLVYSLDEKFICEARAVQKMHPVARISGRPEDLEAVKEGIRQKRALKRETEKTARAWVADAPALVEIPEITAPRSAVPAAPRNGKVVALPRGEAEYIEAEAAKMKVMELRPRTPDPVYMTEPDRYEALLERECRGDEIALDDMTFMRYFEKTSLYGQLKDRFVFLKELWIAGEEAQQ